MKKNDVREQSPAEQLARAKKQKPAPAWGSRRLARRKIVFPNVRLRAVRESLRLTQRDVSAGSGVNNATMADAEAGFEITLTNAAKLAAFYGKPIEELWTLQPKPPGSRPKPGA